MKEFKLNEIINFMVEQVDKYFEKKDFKEFNYLTIEFEMKYILIVFFTNIIVSVGVALFSILNNYEEFEFDGSEIFGWRR